MQQERKLNNFTCDASEYFRVTCRDKISYDIILQRTDYSLLLSYRKTRRIGWLVHVFRPS